MVNRYTLIILSVAVLLSGSIACIRVGELEVDTQKVDLGNADQVKLDLKLGAGELNIMGGGSRLMDATFSYNVRRWKPTVEYEILGGRGELTVKQGRTRGIPFGTTKNKWEIYLGKNIPFDFEIDFGAGEGNLDCREIDVRTLVIDMGVGDLFLDLRGERINDMDVNIDGGVGSGKIYLPHDIGVRVHIDGGIGSVEAVGLQKKNDVYVNEAYERSEVTLDIDIDAGIGSIDLIVKDTD
jgi:hypothetical protein